MENSYSSFNWISNNFCIQCVVAKCNQTSCVVQIRTTFPLCGVRLHFLKIMSFLSQKGFNFILISCKVYWKSPWTNELAAVLGMAPNMLWYTVPFMGYYKLKKFLSVAEPINTVAIMFPFSFLCWHRLLSTKQLKRNALCTRFVYILLLGSLAFLDTSMKVKKSYISASLHILFFFFIFVCFVLFSIHK